MRAAGVSKMQIIGSVLRAAILLLIGATALGEGLGPPLKVYAENYKATQL